MAHQYSRVGSNLSVEVNEVNLSLYYGVVLRNTQHVVLRNRPTLSIGTERLVCLNNPHGVQLETLA